MLENSVGKKENADYQHHVFKMPLSLRGSKKTGYLVKGKIDSIELMCHRNQSNCQSIINRVIGMDRYFDTHNIPRF